MQQLYKHYSMLDQPWPWLNFNPHEVSCKHCGELHYDATAMNKLQRLRDLWGRPIVINSGHRCKSHNNNVGGSPTSQHLKIAFDCRIAKDMQDEFIHLAKQVGFTGIGIYRSFVHLDSGPQRTWKG